MILPNDEAPYFVYTTKNWKFLIYQVFIKKVIELVGGKSTTNGTTPSSLYDFPVIVVQGAFDLAIPYL